MDTAALIARYDGPVPRYTSYPTAPHFGPAVDGAVYAGWLAALPPEAALSLYLHVPFCAELCWFCGCHTTATSSRAALETYADTLLAEIALVSAALDRPMRVAHVHWGGGTPTALPPARLVQVMGALRTHFALDADAEVAVEVDPRTATPEAIAALGEMGCTRASLGVQDFAPEVQQAVNRHQSFEQTRDCADALRAAGVASINLDLMYGLPFQTEAGVAATVSRALDILPDRIAVFGYAHVPWMKKHQALLPEAELPDAAARFAQRATAEAVILGRGWQAIGLDHYARPDDALARAADEGALRRNFQGYTTDAAPVLLGLGASSIGSLPQGYAQNEPSVPAWRDAVRAGRLPVRRGIALSDDDRLRRAVIERIMCDGAVDLDAVAAAQGADPAALRAAARTLALMAQDGLLAWDGRHIRLTEAGRPFVRNVAAAFDAYLRPQEGRHARAV
ncbi:MAG: oxygen-independent coproporphyrinogen III oxidase [Rhodospirillales bacterium 70-18]|nr:oxygen-independent coproporphyrinogen III oxidase [Rhodospirillales bacterium]OJY74277.1 MAG: oxygen-independent coproporphyrinogen III oxidase [Rhodospirillales bacterium 70-18]